MNSVPERYSAPAEEAFNAIDGRVRSIVDEIHEWQAWSLVAEPKSNPQLFRATIREIFYAVHLYQADTTEAGFRMIGRLPKGEVKLLQTLTHHKAEEAEHGLWAWEDFLLLGGSPDRKDRRPQTPATFAVAAVWWWLAESADPFGYLGAEYLFERLTELIAKEVVDAVRTNGMSEGGLRFIIEHATEDIRHASLFQHLLKDTITKRPDVLPAIMGCFDNFRHVYPMPVWEEAYQRAQLDK